MRLSLGNSRPDEQLHNCFDIRRRHYAQPKQLATQIWTQRLRGICQHEYVLNVWRMPYHHPRTPTR